MSNNYQWPGNFLDFSKVLKTHEILDNIENINYKFGEVDRIPGIRLEDFDRKWGFGGSLDIRDWKNKLLFLINKIFKDNSVYSLAILGLNLEDNKIDCVSYGPHILVTNKINIENLITYVEGQIDAGMLSLESPTFYNTDEDSDNIIIQFKYREITQKKDIHKSVSNIDYTDKMKIDKIDFSKSEELNKINNNKNILKYINIIPLTSDFNTFGKIINNNHILSDGTIGVLFKYNEKIEIFIYDNVNESYKGLVYKNSLEYMKFEDTIVNNEEYNLIRKIGNNLIYIKNYNIKYMETIIKSKLIQQKHRNLVHDTNYLTFDIECYLDNNEFIPYACGWYSKDEYKLYYITDYKSWEDMILVFLNDMEDKFNKYTIYIHNLSSFDSIYLLKILYKYFKSKPIFKDNKVISINIYKKYIEEGKPNVFKLFFKDSLKLLPLSLKHLISAFSVETKKLPFPYLFVNKNNLIYIGDIPSYEYFNKQFNIDNYNEYLKLARNYNKDWNLKEETLKYLHNDVKSLYEIIDKFSKEVYDLERINVTNNISISSLSLNTFLTNYYDQNKTSIHIPRINQYNEIKSAYFGGRTEVFKTYGEDLHIYDVNSLYSKVMLQDMPIGNIIKSTDYNLDNYFGYCYATVNVPENINNPILSYRDELGNVYNPTGNWTSMFSSEILKLARDIDNVQITIHYGYKFERGKDIFKEYINSYFNMKNLARIENNEGKRFLSKLMLNTPYGRFGLKYQDSITKFVTSSQAKDLFLKYQILENIVIDEENDLELIKYILEPSDVLKDIDNKSYLELISNKGTTNEDFINRSVSIAAMITSYATIFMNKYINIPNNECYYTATDSLVLQHPLESKYVGNDLGQFKYIGKVKRGYFISPLTQYFRFYKFCNLSLKSIKLKNY